MTAGILVTRPVLTAVVTAVKTGAKKTTLVVAARVSGALLRCTPSVRNNLIFAIYFASSVTIFGGTEMVHRTGNTVENSIVLSLTRMRYSCSHQGHTGSKTLRQQKHAVPNWGSQLMQFVLYNGLMAVQVLSSC